MSEIAIKVNDVSKLYKLYDKPSDRFKEALGLTKEKKYKEHYALHNVSFDVERGQTVGIIGTNGSGKSTILKIITGVLSATEGTVDVKGRISALLELGAGFNQEYTGMENIYLNGTMMGYSKEEVDAKVQMILDFADIGDFINQPVKTYSSGMFVRLAFAVAINIDPEILIVDEALSVGDVFFQAKCYHKFEEFKKNGKTILMVSHDLGSIAKYCDKVVLLNKGHMVEEGEPKKIVDLYKQILVSEAEGREPDEEQPTIDGAGDADDSSAVWKDILMQNPNVLDYGDKEAEIIDFAIIDDKKRITNNIQKNTEFKIRMKVRFHKDIEQPIFAFTIKDLQGTDVTGTNTMYEKVDFGTVKKDEIKVIEFTQNMNLQGRNYLLSFGVVGYKDNDFVVYHRLYDVCNINVISDKDTVGFYDMNSKVSVLE
ncbi:MAG: ABC transporter ATP-binding protein [Lachnospiraceae bacterium]|nr:ABC transporter ATP-binding protein [Lachnospiraceae bacterium]MBQ9232564.1 ABC transporter ATP-binding protein [Lachnospiraceae bacterium]